MALYVRGVVCHVGARRCWPDRRGRRVRRPDRVHRPRRAPGDGLNGDRRPVDRARPVTGDAEPPRAGRRGGPPRWPRMVGPALLVSAGYVDPGNWGTDVAAGAAATGTGSIWVLAAAILAALFLQQLAARVGLATGHDLATLLRRHVRRAALRLIMPPLFLALAVTETVELLGVVFGVRMLTGWSVVTGGAGCRPDWCWPCWRRPAPTARRVVYGCLGLVAVVYLAALGGHGAIRGASCAHASGRLPAGSAPVAVGLIGSIVMPHNILLQSALARDLAGTDPVARGRSPLRGSLVTTAPDADAGLRGQRGDPSRGAPAAAEPTWPCRTRTAAALRLGVRPVRHGDVRAHAAGVRAGVLDDRRDDQRRRAHPAACRGGRCPPLARRAVFLVPATVIAASPLPAAGRPGVEPAGADLDLARGADPARVASPPARTSWAHGCSAGAPGRCAGRHGHRRAAGRGASLPS